MMLLSISHVFGSASWLPGTLGWRVTFQVPPPSQYIGANLAAMGISTHRSDYPIMMMRHPTSMTLGYDDPLVYTH